MKARILKYIFFINFSTPKGKLGFMFNFLENNLPKTYKDI